AVAAAGQHGDAAVDRVVDHQEVDLAVAVPVGGLDVVRGGAAGVEDRRFEGATAHREQDLDVVAGEVGGGEVGLAVAVVVGDRDHPRAGAGGEGGGGLEGAVAVAE